MKKTFWFTIPALALLGFPPLGCYQSHDAGGLLRLPDGGVQDAGARDGGVQDAGIRDAGPRPDSGLPPSCVARRPDFACTDTGNGSVPIGRPYLLPISIGGLDQCFCGETVECTARVLEPGRIELLTSMCSELLCDACFPFVTGTCELPSLTEGEWVVQVNGRDSFDLKVSDALPGVGPVDVCATLAGPDPICDTAWPQVPEDVGAVCVPRLMPAGLPVPLDVVDFCGQCGHAVGSCEVTRAAGDIIVTPQSVPPDCLADCFDMCRFEESRCVIPPLPPGDYTVTVAGLPGSAPLRIRADVELPVDVVNCLSLPED